MNHDASELSPLSCLACRRRKVRCNRKKPTCGRCIDRELACLYPQRMKRNSAQQLSGQPLSNQADVTQLHVVLNQWLPVEKNMTGKISLDSQLQPPSLSTPESSVHSAGSHLRRWRAATPGFESPTNSRVNLPVDLPSLEGPSRTCFETLPSVSAADVIEALEAALKHVQTLRTHTISRLSLGEPLRLPQEVARSWIKTFFEVQPVDMFLGFTNTKLIKLVPDLIDMPDVILRPVIHVLYFSILHYGSCMPLHYDFKDEHREVDYPTLAYVGALRALPSWQREAVGTKMDFAAAILMALAASENFDFDMAWQMFQLASKYGRELQLHRLDTDSVQDIGVATNNERRSLWDLIGKDLFCRLLFDRPAIITEDLSRWRVNLPWLDHAQDPNVSNNVTDLLAMVFLLRSRLTFALNDFFQVMRTGDAQTIVKTTDKLCRELGQVYDEWPISQYLRDATQQEGMWWRKCEVYLDGYSSMVMMLCKANRIDTRSSSTGLTETVLLPSCPNNGSLSPFMIDVTRRLLTIVGNFLAVFPVPPTVSLVFGLYRCYFPVGNLARRVLETRSSDQDSPQDANILDRISAGVDRAARNCKDLQPLIVTLKNISRTVHMHIGHNHEAQ